MRVFTEESKKKISLANKGRKLSEEHKKKLSEAHKGKKVTITWGDKLSKSLKGHKKSEHCRLAMSKSHKGLKQSEAMKKKRNQSLALFYKNKPTSIELKLYKYLSSLKIVYDDQKVIGRFRVDAYIPSLNLVIEADGDYWHNLDRVKIKDKAENAYLLKCGYKLLRISETDFNSNKYISILDGALNERH